MSTTTYLLQTLISVAVVIVMGALVTLGLRRASTPERRGPLERLASLPLDGRRSIHLVGIGDSVLVVGASEGGLTKLGEMPRSSVPAVETRRASFSDIVARLTSPKSAS